MKTPEFNHNQVVKIENKEQFDSIYHILRSAKNGISLNEWLRTYGYPIFPLYLEHFAGTIGYTHEPISKCEVILLDDACNNNQKSE